MSAYRDRTELRARRDAAKWAKENPWGRTDGGLQVNAGIAKEAYFASNTSRGWTYDPKRGVPVASNDKSLWKLLDTNISGNAPVEQARTDGLWNLVTPTKGMFATSVLNSPTYQDPRGAAYKLNNFTRYGFQFHYNPTTIAMSYAANPEFDITTFTSGTDPFNILGPNVTQSTLSFNIVLNRLHDMKYFQGSNGLFKTNVRQSDWSGKFPKTSAEQRAIYNKGTMYDVEYFLRAVMQVTQTAAFKDRNVFDGKTADLGFLTGVPVDLHLGKSLRYWVKVDSFNLNHVIFNERMVPLFTEMSISCSRIPDYGGDTSSSSSDPAQSDTPPINSPYYNENPDPTSTFVTTRTQANYDYANENLPAGWADELNY